MFTLFDCVWLLVAIAGSLLIQMSAAFSAYSEGQNSLAALMVFGAFWLTHWGVRMVRKMRAA